jgi:hypothetical protein
MTRPVTVLSFRSHLRLDPQEIGQVELLGVEGALRWSRGKNGLKVHLPERKPGEAAYVLKITPRLSR